ARCRRWSAPTRCWTKLAKASSNRRSQGPAEHRLIREASMTIALYVAAAVIMAVGSLYFAWRNRDFRKFLAGAFFVSSGILFYLYLADVSVLCWEQVLSKHLRSAVADPSSISSSSCFVSILASSGSQRLKRVEPPGIATAFWRSVGPSHNVFVTESFIDEMAATAKQDAVAYRRALLDKSPRAKAVLDLAAEKAGWGQALPKGSGRGVSLQFVFGSYQAHVAEVEVSNEGTVRVGRVVCAV